jgi:hypothetical protein
MALFDVFLRDFDEPFPIIAFALNVGASDTVLTGSGSDFGRFAFTLAPDIASLLSLSFDSNISDDGRVEFGADLPPFGTDIGIPAAAGDVRLGTLSVLAPSTPGSFAVGLQATPAEPIFGGGSYLLLDDGDLGIVLPGGGTLGIVNTSLSVVPEPSTLTLAGIGVFLGVAGYFRGQRRPPARARFVQFLSPFRAVR